MLVLCKQNVFHRDLKPEYTDQKWDLQNLRLWIRKTHRVRTQRSSIVWYGCRSTHLHVSANPKWRTLWFEVWCLVVGSDILQTFVRILALGRYWLERQADSRSSKADLVPALHPSAGGGEADNKGDIDRGVGQSDIYSEREGDAGLDGRSRQHGRRIMIDPYEYYIISILICTSSQSTGGMVICMEHWHLVFHLSSLF